MTPAKEWTMDQRHRLESPEVNPHKHRPSVFDKGTAATQQSKDRLFNKQYVQTPACERMSLGTHLGPFTTRTQIGPQAQLENAKLGNSWKTAEGEGQSAGLMVTFRYRGTTLEREIGHLTCLACKASVLRKTTGIRRARGRAPDRESCLRETHPSLRTKGPLLPLRERTLPTQQHNV